MSLRTNIAIRTDLHKRFKLLIYALGIPKVYEPTEDAIETFIESKRDEVARRAPAFLTLIFPVNHEGISTHGNTPTQRETNAPKAEQGKKRKTKTTIETEQTA